MTRRLPWSYLLLALFVASCTAERPAAATGLECVHIPQIFEFYLRSHYTEHKVNDELRKRTVEQFLKNLDASKTMLLQSDVEKLRGSLPKLFDAMPKGKCEILDEARGVLVERSKQNEKMVTAFLGPQYKLDENIELMLNPRKRDYAKTEKERDGHLQKLLHFQISNYLMTKTKLDDAKKQLVHRYELITRHLEKRGAQEFYEQFAQAFAQALDPHSSFLSRDDLEDFRITMQLSLEGIGAALTSQDGFTVIEELVPGGVAEKSKKLEPKDKIVAVAEEGKTPVQTIDMDLRDVVRLVRGKKGTTVRLTILRQAETTKTFEVALVRDKIDLKEGSAKITYDTRGSGKNKITVGILELPSFYGGGGRGTRVSSDDVRALLVEAKKKKADAILLDLSSNGGGLLEEAVKISGFFVRKGAVVATKDTDQGVKVLSDDDSDVVWTGPVGILTTRLSASASEIFAGALRDYKRAFTIGTDHTFGKGTVQLLQPLPLDLGGIKVTTGMFFLPGGQSTQNQGVVSDVKLPSTFNDEEIGERTLDYALKPQVVPNFVSEEANSANKSEHWDPVSADLFPDLEKKAKERIAKNTKYQELIKSADESKKNGGVIKLAELRKKSEKENSDDKKKKESNKKKSREAYGPLLEESVSIVADYVTGLRAKKPASQTTSASAE